jgi:hypothetical protein
MEVDLSSIMVSAPEPSTPTDYSRFNLPDMEIQDNMRAEKTRTVDKERENAGQDSRQDTGQDTKNPATDEDQRVLATQIRQCFEEFPEKLSILKKTKLEGKIMEELQKI